MIQFKDVSKIYRMGENSLRALDHANMHIREGEFVSIIGPSGSGTYKEDQLARIRNEKIGFVFQNFNLIGKMTAWDNIELPLIYQRLPRAQRKERVEEALRRVGLYDRRTHRPTELSGGQQQRVAIARAISTRPSLFLADEPTGNLDSRTGEEIMDIFRELHEEGNTIVLITHDPSIADKAQRQIRIRDGKVQEL